MRIGIALCVLALAGGEAGGQTLGGAVPSGINGGFQAGLNGGIASGFQSGLGSNEGSGRAQTGRRGLTDVTCAPTQMDYNHTGCRPVREMGLEGGGMSLYDMSVQAMGPLQGLTLQGLTLEMGAGPAGPQ